MRDSCGTLVKLPMRDGVESLNLSVAAGVMLYAVRERL
jgi:tRNA G18 (ribose-2'-O)-methylase SpoU